MYPCALNVVRQVVDFKLFQFFSPAHNNALKAMHLKCRSKHNLPLSLAQPQDAF